MLKHQFKSQIHTQELCIVSRWPYLAKWVGFTLPQLAQIDLSSVDVPLNTKQTNAGMNKFISKFSEVYIYWVE